MENKERENHLRSFLESTDAKDSLRAAMLDLIQQDSEIQELVQKITRKVQRLKEERNLFSYAILSLGSIFSLVLQDLTLGFV